MQRSRSVRSTPSACVAVAALVATFATALAALLVVPASPALAEKRPVRIATTASLDRSGLLAVLLPVFAQESGRSVRVIGRGPAQAIALARRGEADVVLVPESAELGALFTSGLARSRVPVFATRFVIAGPAEDPAAVARAKTTEAAIAQIFRLRAPFVRRADDSDVREAERALFEAAGVDSEVRWESLLEVTTGMVGALESAGERRAYVLADLAAFLAAQQETNLVALSRETDALRQPYSVVRLDEIKLGHPIESEGAAELERFLLSERAQALVRDFGVGKLGAPVFTPVTPVTPRSP